MEEHFYDQYTFAISLIGFETMQQKGKNAPELLCCSYIPSLFQIDTLNIWNEEESFNIVHVFNIIWTEKL
jgi:hypothetical protein